MTTKVEIFHQEEIEYGCTFQIIRKTGRRMYNGRVDSYIDYLVNIQGPVSAGKIDRLFSALLAARSTIQRLGQEHRYTDGERAKPIIGDEPWIHQLRLMLPHEVPRLTPPPNQKPTPIATQLQHATPDTPAESSQSRRGKLSAEHIQQAVAARAAGKSLQAIAGDLGVDKATVSRALNRVALKPS